MVTQSWFRNLWTSSQKPGFHSHKSQIDVLAFEAAGLMNKLLHLWQSLSDKQVERLRDEISDSAGIKKLVSESDNYIGKLICAEVMESLCHVARAVARLSRKCDDPLLRTFEQAYTDLIKSGVDAYSWQFSWKKMDRKIKKMERFVAANTSLYQEMEMLADLEQSLRRMKGSDRSSSIALVEYEKKIALKKHEVKHLKERSLWSRTYDYTILLLVRSIFTVYGRIDYVFGVKHEADLLVRESNNKVADILNNWRGHSTPSMQSSVYPSENCIPTFNSGLSGKSITQFGPLSRTNQMTHFNSGPLGISLTTSSPIYFSSGPLHRSSPISRLNKTVSNLWPFREKFQKSRAQQTPGPATMSGTLADRRMVPTIPNDSTSMQNSCLALHSIPTAASKNTLVNPPPDTLGAAALALHYSNVVIFIEKLAATPHRISNEARDDLYNMLPASIRSSLRAKLKPYARSLGPSAYDTGLAKEWSDAIRMTLEWLAPLAHNMLRWQSERSFEHQGVLGERTNVLLVQTLYFASQEKTEAAITELLVGLNYIWRLGREVDARLAAGAPSGRTFDEYVE